MEQVGGTLFFKKLTLCQSQLIPETGNRRNSTPHRSTTVTYNTAIGNIHGDFTNVEIAFVSECSSKC